MLLRRCYGYRQGFPPCVRKMAVRHRNLPKHAAKAEGSTAAKAKDKLNERFLSSGRNAKFTLLSFIGVGKAALFCTLCCLVHSCAFTLSPFLLPPSRISTPNPLLSPSPPPHLYRLLPCPALPPAAIFLAALQYHILFSMFENDRYFSSLSELEREMSFRTEMVGATAIT